MREMAPPLELTGLRPAPAQTFGAFRLIPLLRETPCEDVRLSRAVISPGVKTVDLPGRKSYTAFVPHGLRLTWGSAAGTQVKEQDTPGDWQFLESVHRLRKKDGEDALRFLPQHLAIEGLLELHFKPPTIAWQELSQGFRNLGMTHRSESFFSGQEIPGYATALRTFELHRGQVGMLVHTSDTLMAAFVVPTAEDYRLLHRTLLDDLYGELMMTYALNRPNRWLVDAGPHFAGAKNIDGLREALERVRRDWSETTTEILLGDWKDRPLLTETVYRPGSMRLERFVTDLELHRPNHIGERLVRDDGELLYVNTLRLSSAQTRRAHLLHQLSAHDWNLHETAAALGTDLPGLVARITARGFGHLINNTVREQAAKKLREQGRLPRHQEPRAHMEAP